MKIHKAKLFFHNSIKTRTCKENQIKNKKLIGLTKKLKSHRYFRKKRPIRKPRDLQSPKVHTYGFTQTLSLQVIAQFLVSQDEIETHGKGRRHHSSGR